MKLEWKYDACGEYAEYRVFLIIKQDHPKLDKYLLAFEDENEEIRQIETASTLKYAKAILDETTLFKCNGCGKIILRKHTYASKSAKYGKRCIYCKSENVNMILK